MGLLSSTVLYRTTSLWIPSGFPWKVWEARSILMRRSNKNHRKISQKWQSLKAWTIQINLLELRIQKGLLYSVCPCKACLSSMNERLFQRFSSRATLVRCHTSPHASKPSKQTMIHADRSLPKLPSPISQLLTKMPPPLWLRLIRWHHILKH